MSTEQHLTRWGWRPGPNPFGQRNVAHAALIALETAEAALMPAKDAHSRLYVAIQAAEATMAYVSFPTDSGRTRLRLRLEDLQRVESTGVALGNLHPDSLIQRGLSLGIHITQAALAGVSSDSTHALHECNAIVRLAGRIT